MLPRLVSVSIFFEPDANSVAVISLGLVFFLPVPPKC